MSEKPVESVVEGTTEAPKPTCTVQINYRSGKTMIVEAESFDIKHNSGQLTSLSYVVVGKVKPLYFGGLESVESVYQIS